MVEIERNLRGKALLWFEFVREELTNFENFRKEFIKKWMPEKNTSKEETFWRLIGEEPESSDIVSYLYELKLNCEGSDFKFERSRERIAEISPQSLKSTLLNCDTWMELHDITTENEKFIQGHLRNKRNKNVFPQKNTKADQNKEDIQKIKDLVCKKQRFIFWGE